MTKTWWKESVVYQIYPRSYKDSNGDGIGDIRGIIQKLDYIKSLGVDVIWLCPIYKSPNDDNGYDISDYYDIIDEFGTMQDFDEMLSKVHELRLKLVMDLVANHTSDEHGWFEESRSSKDNPKRDYYIWKKGKDSRPPNNWTSFFSGPAWEYDELTDEYYLHLFTKKQPDLNWENPEVRKEIYKLMRFWLGKGVDGFRMDAISMISKRNYEDTPYLDFSDTIENVYTNGPMIHDYLQEMNREVLSKYDIMTVGEGFGIDLSNGLDYVAEDRNELKMLFHFDHMVMDHGEGGKFDPKPVDLFNFKDIFVKWDALLKERGWGSIFLGNHDFPRIVSRFGNDVDYWEQSAKLLTLLLNTLRGTVYLYQGDEIGMTNVAFKSIEDYDDVEIQNAYREWVATGKDTDQFLKAVHKQGRDNARTPIQWDNSANAGFTSGNPWIKLNPNYQEINIKNQESDEHSILNFYREVIRLRKTHQTLVYGDFSVIQLEHPKVFAYWRWDEVSTYLVLLNFSNDNVSFEIDKNIEPDFLEKLISNYSENTYLEKQTVFLLKPWEGTLFKLTNG